MELIEHKHIPKNVKYYFKEWESCPNGRFVLYSEKNKCYDIPEEDSQTPLLLITKEA